ncbi:MAG: enoyl-CoA hydratase/isomerase family protein [Gammaproteobacteria bacterium]|nr:enoyl-CoA hydratase/isomerase family protein [Gammaproteobacteria bacterium]
MNESITVQALRELSTKLADARDLEHCSALFGQPLVLFEATPDTLPGSSTELEILHARLGELPCPVIAIHAPGERSPAAELASLADVVVESTKEAQPLIRNIRANPFAAMVLVQLLRHNARSEIADGLFAESLAFATLQGGAEFHAFLQKRAAAGAAPPAPTPQPDDEPVVLLTREDDVLSITLNQPERRNAFSVAMRDGLIEGLHLLADDSSIRRAIIRGAGACFCTGGDLDEFGLAGDPTEAHAIRSTRNAGRLIAEQSARIECRVHRACIGSGIELPAFAGRLVASADTNFQLPEITLGLIPGAGGTVSITRRIGRQRTAYLALSARRINAQTALAWGLIDAIE